MSKQRTLREFTAYVWAANSEAEREARRLELFKPNPEFEDVAQAIAEQMAKTYKLEGRKV